MTSYKIHFVDQFPNDSYKLLEVNNDVLQDLKVNDRLIIKGKEKNDEAILCTSNKTYTVKSGHTSNTMLLSTKIQTETKSTKGSVSVIETKLQVSANIQLQYELVEIQPRLSSIKPLLLSRAIKNDDDLVEDNIGFTIDELVSQTQASKVEIENHLKILNVYHLDGGEKIALLSQQYQNRLFEFILTECNLNGWSISAIPMYEAIGKISAAPQQLMAYIFSIYGEKTQPPSSVTISPGEVYYSLSVDSICIFRAKQLFLKSTQWEYEQFMDNWKDIVELGITPKVEMLRGIAIVLMDKTQNPYQVNHLLEEELPLVPKERFALLFKLQPKWIIQDLEYYVKKIVPNDLTFDQFLSRHTRTTPGGPNGQKLYISKF